MSFGGYLKADTQTNVTIGPVVAVANGYVPVTNLALSTADEAELIKHNATTTTDISGLTMAAIANCDGYYALTLTAAVLDTEGRLTIAINDDSLCLPVNKEFEVVNANVYDSMFAAATTDYLQVDMLQVVGVAQSATDLKDFADTGYDPATHKVAGVVLTDTCTANTDMRGTDSAALASVCTEARLARLDAAVSTLALASVCTEARLARLDATISSRSSHSAADVKTAIEAAGSHLALVLEDTGTTLPTTLGALALEAGGNVAAVKAQTDKLAFAGTGPYDVKSTLDSEEVTPTAASKTGYAIGTGGIAAAAFAAGAIDAAALAADAAAEIADAILGRNIAGGSSTGRTVGQALALMRNKWAKVDATLTVYATDDVTPLWTATIATTAGDPISSVDPA